MKGWNITPKAIYLYTIQKQETPFKLLEFGTELEFMGISDVVSLPADRFVDVQHFSDLFSLHYFHPDGSFEKEEIISSLCNRSFAHSVDPLAFKLFFTFSEATIVCYDLLACQVIGRFSNQYLISHDISERRAFSSCGDLVLFHAWSSYSRSILTLVIQNLSQNSMQTLETRKALELSLASRDGKFLIAIERQTLFLYEICTTSKKPLADDPAAEVNFRDQNDTDPFQGHTASPMVTASM